MRFAINYGSIGIMATVGLLATIGDTTKTWTSTMFAKLYSNDSSVNPLDEPITPEQDAWIGSIVNVGAVIGPFPFALLAETFGRKLVMLLMTLPYLISFLISALATDVYLFYFTRLISGLSAGAGYVLIPIYLAEIGADSKQKIPPSVLNCFWTFGNLVPFMGTFMSVKGMNFSLAALPVIFLVAFYFIAPESPYYLVQIGNLEKAKKTLVYLRGNQSEETINSEFLKIQKIIEDEHQETIWVTLKSKEFFKLLLVISAMMIIPQLTGINALLFHMQSIFRSAESIIPDEIACNIFGWISFASSFFVPFLTNQVGRKKLLIYSCFGVLISLLVLGLYFIIKDYTKMNIIYISWLPLLILIAYIVCFNIGLGSVPWSMAAELFPSNIKMVTAPLVTCINWLSSFVVTKFFNKLVDGMGHGGSFMVFGFWALVGGVFCIKCLKFIPEAKTEKKSFKEIKDNISEKIWQLKCC